MVFKGLLRKGKKRGNAAVAAAAGKSFKVPIPNFAFVVMGRHSSGHNDSSKLEHSVASFDNEGGGVIIGMDVAEKTLGSLLLADWTNHNEEMTVEEWAHQVHAEGSEEVMEEAMRDLFIRTVDVKKFCEGADEDEIMNDIFTKLVELATDSEDPLMPLHFENGDSCSSGGYSERAESLLFKIPFFVKFLGTISECFDIKSLWCRASVEGTHKKHNDTFRRGATHRIIFSINCYGKEMHFHRD